MERIVTVQVANKKMNVLEVLLWAVAVLWSMGIGFIALPAKQLVLARVCFYLSAVLSLMAVIYFGVTTEMGTAPRTAILTVLTIAIVLIAVQLLRITDQHDPSKGPAAVHEPKIASEPRTDDDWTGFEDVRSNLTIFYGNNMVNVDHYDEKNKVYTPALTNSFAPLTLTIDADGNRHLTWRFGSGQAEIVDNKVTRLSPGWEMNHDRDALEIINEQSDPVAQLVRVSKHEWRLYGQFLLPGRRMLTMGPGAGMFEQPMDRIPALGDRQAPLMQPLPRIFKYPTHQFPGQREPYADEYLNSPPIDFGSGQP